MARTESDVHHLRGQADLDRRALADIRADLRSLSEVSGDRHVEIKLWVATLDSYAKQVGEAVQRVELRQIADSHALAAVRDVQIEARGAWRFAKWAIGLVGLLQAGHWCWELLR
jgi:hypothetical protein